MTSTENAATPTDREREIALACCSDTDSVHDAIAQALADQRAKYESAAASLDPVEVALSGVSYVVDQIERVAR